MLSYVDAKVNGRRYTLYAVMCRYAFLSKLWTADIDTVLKSGKN